MKSFSYLTLLTAFTATGCMSAPSDAGATSIPIVGGERETGRPEVVFLYNVRGSACTASIISPYVVLTANHCVEVGGSTAAASSFRIYVGPSTSRLTAEYRVSDVRPVPGAGLGGGRSGNDLALLVLATPARETPLEIGRGRPVVALAGQTMTAVGYGQTPSGGSGIKYTATMGIDGFDGGFIFVEPSVCSGDSGGPLIAPDGMVYGVASFTYSTDGSTRPTCGTAPGAYNEIYRHLAFIDEVLTETGSCIPSGEEVCNGLDDNCDEVVDEGCIAIGDPCAASDECVGGLCAETAVGRICTSECDMLRPDQGCGLGFYCGDSGGCAGHCVSGVLGALGNEAECSANTDCASLFCFDPGDGRRRCLDPCRADAGLCFAGEVCPATPGNCGGCVPEMLVSGRRGLGEPCDVDADCGQEMVCREHGGIRECAGPCADGMCADGFECRDDLCITDRVEGVGGVCIDGPDCGEAICASLGERRWCTAICASSDECPSGFDCVPAGEAMVCAPVANLDGESCVANSDCASGLCAALGAESFCTSYCDPRDDCAAGFQCQRTSTGASEGVCVPVRPEDIDGGGCSVVAGERRTAPWLVGLFVLFVLGWRRRR